MALFRVYLADYPSERQAPLNILTRYTLKQIWIPALMAAVVISFVVMLGSIGQEIQFLREQLPVARITVFDISRISFYSLPALTGLIIPVTFLLGIMLTFGRMAQTSELIAAKAAGIPLRRLVLPVVAMGAVVSLACFFLLDRGQPWAYQRLAHLLGSEMPLRVTLDAVPTGVMHEYGDWRVYIGERSPDKTLHNIIVLQDKGSTLRTYYAKSARIFQENGVGRLQMKEVWPIGDDDQTQYSGSFTITLPTLDTLKLEDERQGWTLARMLKEERVLRDEAKSGNQHIRAALAKLRVDIGERLSFPLMCLAVSIVAAPIGARARRSGRSFTFASGLTIVAAYFVLRALLKDIDHGTLVTAILITQIPNIVLIGTGLFLIWRVDRV